MQLNLLSELERFPGVESAGMTNFLPATGATLNYQIVVEGLAQTEENGTYTVGERTVDRGLSEGDEDPSARRQLVPDAGGDRLSKPAPGKAMVNRRFVELYGKGQNVIGRHFRFAQNPADLSPR